MRWTLAALLCLACNADKPDPSAAPVSTGSAVGAPTGTGTGLATGTGTGMGTGTGTGTATGTVDCTIRTFDDGLKPTSELHVSETGSDGNGDGSVGSPFASIEHAAQLATPGTAVVVHAGTYAGGDFLSDVRGTAKAPIWIGGAAGEARPVISGGSESLHLVRGQYLVIHDLEATGASSNGINADDGAEYANPDAAHHLVFRNLYIHDIGPTGNRDCLKLSGVRNHTVIDSEFHDCGDGGSAVDHVGCHDGLIANNHFHDLGSSGVQTKGGSTNIEIRANLFERAGARAVNLGGSTGFQFFRPPLVQGGQNAEARGLSVVANVFVGSEAPMAFVGCTDCVAAHNTLILPEKWFARILQETTDYGGYAFDPVARGVWINNLVVFTRAAVGTEVNIGPNTDSASFTWTNNLFWAQDDVGNSQPTLPGTETGSVVGVAPDFEKSSYRIRGKGGAFMAGAPSGVMCDADGEPYSDPPSIGAYR